MPNSQDPARGIFLVLVGPDGVGKTTAARTVGARFGGTARYFHFRPPVRAPLESIAVLDEAAPPVVVKATTPVALPAGWARLAVSFVRFWAGYLARVRPALRNGELVIGDRWAYPYLVQPRAVRFGGPAAMARTAIALLPRPDLVVNLAASASIVHARKQELTIEEIERELDAWKHLRAPVLHTVNAERSADDVAHDILSLMGRN